MPGPLLSPTTRVGTSLRRGLPAAEFPPPVTHPSRARGGRARDVTHLFLPRSRRSRVYRDTLISTVTSVQSIMVTLERSLNEDRTNAR